jgi:hypothetical protein
VLDRLLDAHPDELTVVGVDEPDELRIRPAERTRLEAEHQLELLRPLEPARHEIPSPRPHTAGIECQAQALLAQPELLLAILPSPSGVDLLELPGNCRDKTGEVALVDEVPGSCSERIGSLLLPDHAGDQDGREIDVALSEQRERVEGGSTALQAVVEEHELPRTVVKRLQHLAAARDPACNELEAASAQLVQDQLGVAGRVLEEQDVQGRGRLLGRRVETRARLGRGL